MYEVSHNSFIESQMILVPVIASFDTAGVVKPLFVRIGDESYKILHPVQTNSIGLDIFRCKINDHGILKPLQLSYHVRDGFWTIPKINSCYMRERI